MKCVRFGDAGTRDIADRINTKAARATLPPSLVKVARRKLDAVLAVTVLDQLNLPPGNRLEALRGSRKGQHSIRINDQYRICFIWNGSEAVEIEIVDYH
jgi:proteic killer suppression protein